MSLDPFEQSQSIFEQVRNQIRAKALGRPAKTATTATEKLAQGAAGVASPSSPASPVSYDSPYMSAQAAPSVASGSGMSPAAAGETSQGFLSDAKAAISGFGDQIAGVFGFQTSPAAEAAREAAVPTGVFDTVSGGNFTKGKIGQGILAVMDPSPFNVLSGMMSGKTITMPGGKQSFMPSGILGKIGEMNVNAQYNIAAEVTKGTPGYHQFYAGENIVGITPGAFGKGYTITGAFQGTPEQAIGMYAAGVMGVDPRSVDLSQDPNSPQFGDKLAGWSALTGGVAKDGMLVGPSGAVDNPAQVNFSAHIGLVNDIMGEQAALNAIQNAALAPDAKSEMMTAVRMGAMKANPLTDAQGKVFGYETATGSFLTDSNGNVVTDGSGKGIGVGTGAISVQDYNAAVAAMGTPGVDAGGGFMGGGADTGFAGISPSDFSFGVDLSDDVSDDESYSPAADNGGGDVGSSTSSASSGSGMSPAAAGEMARGGYAMAEGGTPPAVAQPQQSESAGFVDRPPEQVSEAESVADNVPADVEEGTFVLNAPAVEFMGSEDVKKMLVEATDEAERQGVDIVQNNTKMDKKKLLSLVVSKGEVLIPPVLAKIIGYDRLEKINNRGKQEVEKRIAENGQDIPPEAQQTASDGGTQNNVADTEVIDVYRSIIAQGGDPGRFPVFEEAFQEYQKGKVYRPMQSEIGTPEFDAEVRSKYGYAFPETKGGMLGESTYRRAPD
jgi:hypothetical protein